MAPANASGSSVIPYFSGWEELPTAGSVRTGRKVFPSTDTSTTNSFTLISLAVSRSTARLLQPRISKRLNSTGSGAAFTQISCSPKPVSYHSIISDHESVVGIHSGVGHAWYQIASIRSPSSTHANHQLLAVKVSPSIPWTTTMRWSILPGTGIDNCTGTPGTFAMWVSICHSSNTHKFWKNQGTLLHCACISFTKSTPQTVSKPISNNFALFTERFAPEAIFSYIFAQLLFNASLGSIETRKHKNTIMSS